MFKIKHMKLQINPPSGPMKHLVAYPSFPPPPHPNEKSSFLPDWSNTGLYASFPFPPTHSHSLTQERCKSVSRQVEHPKSDT
jgi:hypothetical protein